MIHPQTDLSSLMTSSQPRFHTSNSRVCFQTPNDDEHQLSTLYEGSNIDKLMETSFVELDNIVERTFKADSTFNLNSADSFFQRSNNLFHSEITAEKCKKMSNKKVQCQIGSGMSTVEQNRSSSISAVENKLRRLQLLKVIKLLRLVFKHLRECQSKIKGEMQSELEKSKLFHQEYTSKIVAMFQNCRQMMMDKENQIQLLKEQVERLVLLNQKLSSHIEANDSQSVNMLKQIQLEKWRSLKEIDHLAYSNNLKVQELQEKLNQLQTQNCQLQQELAIINDVNISHDVLYKKLQYQNGQLQCQNRELAKRNQQLIREVEESELKYNEDCQEMQNTNQSSLQLQKLNQLYLKEIDSTKKQLRDMQNQNYNLKKESEDFILQELSKYQIFFNNEIRKIRREFNQQLFQKNRIIQECNSKEQAYLHIIAEKNKLIKNQCYFGCQPTKIHQLHNNKADFDLHISGIDTNAQSLKVSKSDKRISYDEDVENQSFSMTNIRNNCDHHSYKTRMTFKKAISLVKAGTKGAIRDITNIANQSRINNKSQTKAKCREYIFRAKEYDQRSSTLAEYLAMKQSNELQFYSSQGMLKNNMQRSKLTDRIGQNRDLLLRR